MRTRTIIEIALSIAGITMLSGSGCNDDLLADPGFDIWCGDQLCTWEIERGKVGKAATWDAMDEGAALAGPRAAISQYAPIDEHDATSICFSLLADRDDGASLYLELDFGDDGVIEYGYAIPSDDWQLVALHAAAPRHYTGVRIRVIKEGWHRGVIAQVRATDDNLEDCGVGAIKMTPRYDLDDYVHDYDYDTGY
jgi:hypothetical protein